MKQTKGDSDYVELRSLIQECKQDMPECDLESRYLNQVRAKIESYDTQRSPFSILWEQVITTFSESTQYRVAWASVAVALCVLGTALYFNNSTYSIGSQDSILFSNQTMLIEHDEMDFAGILPAFDDLITEF